MVFCADELEDIREQLKSPSLNEEYSWHDLFQSGNPSATDSVLDNYGQNHSFSDSDEEVLEEYCVEIRIPQRIVFGPKKDNGVSTAMNQPDREHTSTNQPGSTREQSKPCSKIPISSLINPPSPPFTPEELPNRGRPPKRICHNPNCGIEAEHFRYSNFTGIKVPYCSACFMYLVANNRMRPLELTKRPSVRHKIIHIPNCDRVCNNCKVSSTVCWRFIDDILYCNACGQYLKKWKIQRPISAKPIVDVPTPVNETNETDTTKGMQ